MAPPFDFLEKYRAKDEEEDDRPGLSPLPEVDERLPVTEGPVPPIPPEPPEPPAERSLEFLEKYRTPEETTPPEKISRRVREQAAQPGIGSMSEEEYQAAEEARAAKGFGAGVLRGLTAGISESGAFWPHTFPQAPQRLQEAREAAPGWALGGEVTGGLGLGWAIPPARALPGAGPAIGRLASPAARRAAGAATDIGIDAALSAAEGYARTGDVGEAGEQALYGGAASAGFRGVGAGGKALGRAMHPRSSVEGEPISRGAEWVADRFDVGPKRMGEKLQAGSRFPGYTPGTVTTEHAWPQTVARPGGGTARALSRSGNFDPDVFSGLSQAEMLSYAQKNLTFLGKGAGRQVFDLGDGKVLKVYAPTKPTRADMDPDKVPNQNLTELEFYRRIPDDMKQAVPQVLDASPGGEWIVSERADAFPSSDLNQYLGGDDQSDLLYQAFRKARIKQGDPGAFSQKDQDRFDTVMGRMTPKTRQVYDDLLPAVLTTGLHDLTRPNLGLGRDGNIKIIDTGVHDKAWRAGAAVQRELAYPKEAPSGFNPDELVRLLDHPSPDVRHDATIYAQRNLPKINEGTDREVFDLGDGKVLKLMRKPGMHEKSWQNIHEAEVYRTLPESLRKYMPEIYEVDPSGNGRWAIVEKVEPYFWSDTERIDAALGGPSQLKALEKAAQELHERRPKPGSLAQLTPQARKVYDDGAAIAEQMGLLIDDVLLPQNIGVGADGQIKFLDLGYPEGMMDEALPTQPQLRQPEFPKVTDSSVYEEGTRFDPRHVKFLQDIAGPSPVDAEALPVRGPRGERARNAYQEAVSPAPDPMVSRMAEKITRLEKVTDEFQQRYSVADKKAQLPKWFAEDGVDENAALDEAQELVQGIKVFAEQARKDGTREAQSLYRYLLGQPPPARKKGAKGRTRVVTPKGRIQRAEDLILSGKSLDEVYVGLDQLKREVGKARGMAMRAGEGAEADSLERIYGELRGFLTDGSVWGEQVAKMQSEVNALWEPYLDKQRPFAGLALGQYGETRPMAGEPRGEGPSWDASSSGDVGKIARLLNADRYADQDDRLFIQGLQAKRDLFRRLADVYDVDPKTRASIESATAEIDDVLATYAARRRDRTAALAIDETAGEVAGEARGTLLERILPSTMSETAKQRIGRLSAQDMTRALDAEMARRTREGHPASREEIWEQVIRRAREGLPRALAVPGRILGFEDEAEAQPIPLMPMTLGPGQPPAGSTQEQLMQAIPGYLYPEDEPSYRNLLQQYQLLNP